MQIVYLMSEASNSPISISTDRNSLVSRYKDLTKIEVLKSCWLSYQTDLSEDDTIHVLAAGVSASTKHWLLNNTKAKLIIVEVPTMDEHTPPYGEHPYAVYCEVRVNHFIPQYSYFIDLIEKNPDDLYYLACDDYLHLPTAISKIKHLFKSGFAGFFVPHDYLDNYSDIRKYAELILTSYGHMRSIPCSTPTVVAQGSLWLKYKFEILRAGVFADDGWTLKAFSETKAFTPIPGWSAHLQNNCDVPYTDWYALAKYYLKEQIE